MPWEKSEPMDQRREFAIKALGTLNFRALCQEYGISAKTGYKWRERFLRQDWKGWARNRDPLNASFLRTDLNPKTPEKEELKP
jgi:transposase